ncbi:MAG: hypothetical protein KatS3mg022_1224 [Armatimonadota bacterium]|nr:MAG: hypothetical protein KatS3mg022_1224 [Armatimonadota bacterium]
MGKKYANPPVEEAGWLQLTTDFQPPATENAL